MLKQTNFVKSIFPFSIQNIKYFMANKKNTIVHFDSNETKNLPYNIFEYESMLSSYNLFKRIHKSYLIKEDLINIIEMESGFLRLIDGTILPINNKYFNK